MDSNRIIKIFIELLKKVEDENSLKHLRYSINFEISKEIENRRSSICIFCENNEDKIIHLGQKYRINLSIVKRMILNENVTYKFETIKPFICSNHLEEYSIKQLCQNREIYKKAKENIKHQQFRYIDSIQNLCNVCEKYKVCKECLQKEIKKIMSENTFKNSI